MKLAVLDLDGTLYRGSVAIPGAVETVRGLVECGITVRYLTNNSTATPDVVASKLTSMGFPAPTDWIVTSALGAAWRLEGQAESALALGEIGLFTALQDVDIDTYDAVSEEPPRTPDVVVVGLCRQATYESIARCQRAILGGAKFLATNRDATYPMEDDRLIPGAGTLVAAVTAATGIEPEVVGKPEPYLLVRLMNALGVEPGEVLVVGDRPDTDIEAANRSGPSPFLVLSGVCREAPPDYRGQWAPDINGLTI